jgi:hypothetical protein
MGAWPGRLAESASIHETAKLFESQLNTGADFIMLGIAPGPFQGRKHSWRNFHRPAAAAVNYIMTGIM